ncbi:FeoB-associated Cys-rich membrane protein [Cerasicoccus arenae]|nr:FeoB-associated Cys-rich membrane protein [Cerasicoccus arenae]MBK1857661.1 FeoB-associated Cys-rich membrane protein [Cerasicoccus arenae]
MTEVTIVAAIVLAAGYYLFRCWRKSSKPQGCGDNKSCGCRRKR